MDEAEEKREFWFGARVDAALKESWSKFVNESWLASRGEFFELGTTGWPPDSKRFVVKMAEAHQGDDIGLAIEIWRRFKYVRRTRREAVELKRSGEQMYAFQRHLAEKGLGTFPREPSVDELMEVEIEPGILVWAMEQADERGELWLGSRIDTVLKESWGKFVDESYVESQDDYITKLDKGTR